MQDFLTTVSSEREKELGCRLIKVMYQCIDVDNTADGADANVDNAVVNVNDDDGNAHWLEYC